MSGEPPASIAALHKAVWDVLLDGLPVVITSHARLDGDAAGCCLALWRALRSKGIPAHTVLEQPMPAMFAFLGGGGDSGTGVAQLPPRYNLVVIDCGSLDRAATAPGSLAGRVRTVNIDHHESNANFGDVNYVDPGASSCGEMLFGLLQAGGVPLTREMAEDLFTAIVTDTGQFSHQDTTPEAFRVCAECVRAGARPHELVHQLFMSPSPAQVELRHLALGTLKFYDGGRTAIMAVTGEMYRRTGLGPADTEGFAEVPIAIQGVEASALLKEMPDSDLIKVSMRSRGQVDVFAVARRFGGGGHRHAAGCEIAGDLDHVRAVIAEHISAQCRSDAR